MIEDGFGDIINIPVIMISKEDGEKILNKLKDKKTHVEIKLNFETPEKKSVVDV